MYDLPLVVWVKGSEPTKDEQEFINTVGACTILNARFFKNTQHEKVNAAKVYNLTDNKLIDEMYKDVLVNSKVVVDPTSFRAKAEVKDEIVSEQKQEEVEEQKQDEGLTSSKPKAGRPRKQED